MRKVVDLVWSTVDTVLPTILFLVVTVMVTTDILLRNSLGATIPNGMEIATYAFVWFIFLSASGASREGQHFQVSFLQDVLRGRAKVLSAVFIELVCGAVAILMAQASWEYTSRSWRRLSEGLEIPLGYFYMIFPLCFALMALAHARRIWGLLKNRSTEA